MGLILDSSVVIAAERQGQTAYQMLEAIGAQAADPEIAVSVVTVLELALDSCGRMPAHVLRPFQGSVLPRLDSARLTPWATIFRPSGSVFDSTKM